MNDDKTSRPIALRWLPAEIARTVPFLMPGRRVRASRLQPGQRRHAAKVSTPRSNMGLAIAVILALAATAALPRPAAAQGWQTDSSPSQTAPPQATIAPGGSSTTVIERTPVAGDAAAASTLSQVRLVALLTADGQKIEQDLVWRVFQESKTPGVPGKLVNTLRDASPTVKLAPGDYMINAAFGRAHITRKVTVSPGVEITEPFVLNAGGLRVKPASAITSTGIDASKVHFDILTDERDQLGNRSTVISRAKPGVIIRLNAGIYHIVSTYGDANAIVDSDVTVEAGKLTEATVLHQAARVTLKLVTRQGGEALTDTAWNVMTEDGRLVRKSIGALPTHILAPGTYLVIARSQGKVYRRQFTVRDGDISEVEVIKP